MQCIDTFLIFSLQLNHFSALYFRLSFKVFQTRMDFPALNWMISFACPVFLTYITTELITVILSPFFLVSLRNIMGKYQLQCSVMQLYKTIIDRRAKINTYQYAVGLMIVVNYVVLIFLKILRTLHSLQIYEYTLMNEYLLIATLCIV